MVVASVAASMKDSGSGGVHVDEQLTGAGCAYVQDPPVQVKTCPGHGANVLDIALVLRHIGTIHHDVVCNLLSECF
jgi:hypothetical protein